MAAVVRIKNNRFVKVNLQNKDARCCSFGEIDKPGVLDGYIKAVVHTAYPVFQNNFYGKLRKLILVETKEDDDEEDDDDEEEDDDDHLKFPIFTRGIVAEKCKEVKEGDFLLLEKPFFELSQPQKAKFHIIGDKKCSDICIWIVNKKSTRLLVGKEEENGFEESNSEPEECATDSEDVENGTRNEDDHGETAYSCNQATCSNLKRVTRNKKEVAKPRKSPISTRSESSENDISASARVTRSRAARRNALDQRVTRITSSEENDVIFEESSQKSQTSSSEIERSNTRYSLRKTTDKNNVSPPPTKRGKFRLGPKGTSSSPNDSPELRNVVALEVTPKKLHQTPRKENISLLQAKDPKAIEAPSSEKSNGRTDGKSVKSSPQQKHKVPGSSGITSSATADKKINQWNIDGSSHLQMHGPSFGSPAKSPNTTISNTTDEEVSQENSQPATPSGTFSSKKQKLCGQSDSNPGTPKRTPQAKSKIAGNVTPTRTTNNKPTDAVRSSTNIRKDATKNVVVTLVDIDRVLKKSNISVNKQVKVATHVEDKSQKQTKDNNTSAPQPAASKRAASEPAASTASSNVVTASTAILDVPSTSSTSSNIPTTSNASSSIPSQVASTVQQSVPYTLPASYTKISNVQLNTMCNLYGVVKFFKPPWKSRGTDMCSVVVLADPSSDEPLECVMFKDVVLLPQVRRVGDIVRLHRMNIKKYKDKLQAVSTRGFSALVFDRNVDIPVTKEAARVTTGTFSFEESEKKVVQSLKEWCISRSDLFEEAKFLTVCMVEPDIYFDIVCQVKGISKHNSIDCVVLRVTDGTEPQSEIKSCEDDDSYQIVLATDSCQSPLFDVFLYGDHSTLVMNLEVKVGTILLLHNVHSIATQGGPGASLLDVLEPTLELCIHRGSEYGRGLAVLPPDAEDAQQLVQRIKQQTPVSPKKQS